MEVLEPVELRDALALEVSRLAVLYGIETKPPNSNVVLG